MDMVIIAVLGFVLGYAIAHFVILLFEEQICEFVDWGINKIRRILGFDK